MKVKENKPTPSPPLAVDSSLSEEAQAKSLVGIRLYSHKDKVTFHLIFIYIVIIIR